MPKQVEPCYLIGRCDPDGVTPRVTVHGDAPPALVLELMEWLATKGMQNLKLYSVHCDLCPQHGVEVAEVSIVRTGSLPVQ